MKTSLIHSLAYISICCCLLAACQKNTEQPIIDETGIAGTYSIQSYTEFSAIAGERDLLSEMSNCKWDDEYLLKPDKTYLYKDLGTVCTPTASQPGMWMLTGNNLNFHLYYGKIEKLTSQELVMTYHYSQGGNNYTRTAVFTRK